MAAKTFKVTERTPPVVRDAFESRGWEEAEEGEEWQISWKSGGFKVGEYLTLRGDQRINHFPKSGTIARKDKLVRLMRKQLTVHGSIYNFVPLTFMLPTEYTKFVREYSEQDEKDDIIWICKPADLSRGRKIFLLRTLDDLHYDGSYVVQRYVADPMLLGGFKFDLRIYVLVTSYHPLRVWIYRDGLVRFATEGYDTAELGNLYSHLTNASINKFSASYATEKPVIGGGCKWTFNRLRDHYAGTEIDLDKIWTRIEDVVALTLVAVPPAIPVGTDACFELYGFDFIVDKANKVWLLEINSSPALSMDCEADELVKKPLLADLLDVLHVDRDIVAADSERRSQVSRRGMQAGSGLKRERSLSSGSLVARTKGKGKGKGKATAKPATAKPATAAAPATGSAAWAGYESVGNFSCIFPFNDRTEDISFRTSGANFDVRGAVNEIKNRRRQAMAETKAAAAAADNR